RRYRINWDQLRITSLGPGRRVSGTVNYPVSFVYIKSTEGTTIFNRYYPADRREAMRRGMAVGSYHFFSTRSSGVAQATYFLRRSV
ncbi:GH25 family lysozyme, partial [Acinetobacter sp. 163]|nr:GH25 family lysozyme [Acinetobacter sp. 163]